MCVEVVGRRCGEGIPDAAKTRPFKSLIEAFEIPRSDALVYNRYFALMWVGETKVDSLGLLGETGSCSPSCLGSSRMLEGLAVSSFFLDPTQRT